MEILKVKSGELQRIHKLHSSYLGLQYPLLFPYGEDGYRPDILHSSTSASKKGREIVWKWENGLLIDLSPGQMKHKLCFILENYSNNLLLKHIPWLSLKDLATSGTIKKT